MTIIPPSWQYALLRTTMWFLAVSLPLYCQIPVDHSTGKAINAWRHTVVSESTPERPVEGGVVTTARGLYFDQIIGAQHRLDIPDEATLNTGGFAVDHFFTPDPLPLRNSDLVATAQFIDYWPVLSPSGRSLYTIARFRLDKVIKTPPPSRLPSDVIEILFPGGTLKRIDGSIIRYGLHTGDDIPIELTKRYLLFLNHNTNLDSYEVVKHWELDNGTLRAVDLLERQKERIARIAIQGTSETVLVDKLLGLSR